MEKKVDGIAIFLISRCYLSIDQSIINDVKETQFLADWIIM
jgi:hypothetical protein